MINLEILMTSLVVESDTGFKLMTQWMESQFITKFIDLSEAILSKALQIQKLVNALKPLSSNNSSAVWNDMN